RTAQAIRAALGKLGLSLFTNKFYLADTLSVVNYPPGVEDHQFRQKLNQKGVVVAGGLGPLAGKVFRMGHMGNLSTAQVYFALQALENTLAETGYKFERGASLKAARSILEAKD
ncbi:MAG: aminotransferase, partial [Candidatus Aminicenantales bacterium]